MKSVQPLGAGVFYQLGPGWCMLTSDQEPTTFRLGQEFEVGSMFRVYELLTDQPVGFWLYSAFTVINTGASLAAVLQAKAGRAKSSRIVIRTPDLIVWETDVGALAVSTKASEEFVNNVEEQ